jgi:hypothetical protein
MPACVCTCCAPRAPRHAASTRHSAARSDERSVSLLMSLNRPQPPGIGSVASLLAMDRTTLTAALKPLVSRGLVTISVDRKGRRSRLLTIRPAGRPRSAREGFSYLAADSCRAGKTYFTARGAAGRTARVGIGGIDRGRPPRSPTLATQLVDNCVQHTAGPYIRTTTWFGTSVRPLSVKSGPPGPVRRMSAIPPIAEVSARARYVRNVPVAGSCTVSKQQCFYSITSSAMASTLDGTVRLRAFAVLRLITRSIFVDCCTGISAGFAPLRIWPA